MKVVPLNDKLVVKRLEAEEKTAGGIVLPDTAKEKPKQGKVLSLGDGKLLDSGSRAKFQVKEGDRVLFTSYAGNEVTVDGEEYLIMSEDGGLAQTFAELEDVASGAASDSGWGCRVLQVDEGLGGVDGGGDEQCGGALDHFRAEGFNACAKRGIGEAPIGRALTDAGLG